MAQMNINFNVKWSWWVKPYLSFVYFYNRILGREPDKQKTLDNILKGLKIEVSR